MKAPDSTEVIPLTPTTAPSAQGSLWARVDDEGRLVLPPVFAKQLGLVPGAELRIDEENNSLRLHRAITQLAKVYLEPTNRCNLDCATCFRNAWDSPLGRMSDATFDAVEREIGRLDTPPTIYFGGIGEPLMHPRTIEWIGRAKRLGARTEMITNGTLLDEARSRGLIAAGLDVLWASIDGASPESYADIRLGAELPTVVANLKRFRDLRKPSHSPKPEIGIAFVAMRRNINDLPQVLALAKRLGARHFSVSNVLPVTPELQSELLYSKTLHSTAYLASNRVPRLTLPKMDFDERTRDALFAAFTSGFRVSFAGNDWSGANDVCNYIESGSLTVAWNGDVSPCWPLMHVHMSYLHGKVHTSVKHVIGNVRERGLLDMWLDPEYVAYRKRVHDFAFPPCTFCGGCEVSVANEEDCFGNPFPVCGACLWAQGVLQCP